MKTNMGSIDRVIRVLAAIIVMGLYFAGVISGLTATILMILAAILIITSFVGFCPLYALLGISSKKELPGSVVK